MMNMMKALDKVIENNPIVYALWGRFQQGYYNFEEFLIRCVLSLDANNRSLTNQMIDLINRHQYIILDESVDIKQIRTLYEGA